MSDTTHTPPPSPPPPPPSPPAGNSEYLTNVELSKLARCSSLFANNHSVQELNHNTDNKPGHIMQLIQMINTHHMAGYTNAIFKMNFRGKK